MNLFMHAALRTAAALREAKYKKYKYIQLPVHYVEALMTELTRLQHVADKQENKNDPKA